MVALIKKPCIEKLERTVIWSLVRGVLVGIFLAEVECSSYCFLVGG